MKSLLRLLALACGLLCLMPAAPPAHAQSSGGGASLEPVYRLYAARNDDHLYTADATELGMATRYGYRSEGVLGYAPASGASGAAPVYRLLSVATGEHFYTASADERSLAQAYGFRYEGVGFSVFAAPGAGLLPVYRLYSPSWGRHFYTTSQAEHDIVVQLGWQDEGLLGYLSATAVLPPATPMGLTATGQWVTNCPQCGVPMAHVVLSWNAVPGAAGYRVFRDGTVVGSVITAPAYTDMAVASGRTYSYTVCAVAAGVSGAPSAPAAATAPSPPDGTGTMAGFTAPGNLRVQGVFASGAGTDVLSWDKVSGAATYNVYQYDKLIASAVAGTTFTVPAAQFNGAMTYAVSAVDGDCACESLPSAIANAVGAQSPAVKPSWAPDAPVTPTGLVAVPQWNAGASRVLLYWHGDVTDSTYNVSRDGVQIASNVWRLYYLDGAVGPGETHTYTVTGVNVPWTTPVESAPSAAVPATALTAAPPPLSGKVQITRIVPNDDSALVSFAAVPGAADYRVYNVAKPGSVKYSGGGLSIEMNGLDPAQANSLVVEAVDKLGPFQKMDGAVGPGAMQMDGTMAVATNGQGDPSNVPNVLAKSDPFPVTCQARTLTGAQVFFDNFRNSQPLTPSTPEPAVAALSTDWYEINEVQNDKWRIRTYNADTDMSKVFIMNNHFMDTLYDGPTASKHPFSHNNNASVVMMPKATADVTGGKTLHVTFEVDAHFDGRRWCDVFVAPSGDPLVSSTPTKLEPGQTLTPSGNEFVWQITSDLHRAEAWNAGTETDVESWTGYGDQQGTGRGTPYTQYAFNGTMQDLDKRHKFDLYLSQNRYRVMEDGVVVRDVDLTTAASATVAGATSDAHLRWWTGKVQVYFVHELYHTANDRNETVLYGGPACAYWYNNRPWSDERHWDNMGQEVLTAFP